MVFVYSFDSEALYRKRGKTTEYFPKGDFHVTLDCSIASGEGDNFDVEKLYNTRWPARRCLGSIEYNIRRHHTYVV